MEVRSHERGARLPVYPAGSDQLRPSRGRQHVIVLRVWSLIEATQPVGTWTVTVSGYHVDETTRMRFATAQDGVSRDGGVSVWHDTARGQVPEGVQMQQPGRRPPTMRERWAALAGQQQAVAVLSAVAVALMIVILLVLVLGQDDDDNDVATIDPPTPTPEVVEVTSTPEPTEEPEPEPESTPTPEPEPTPTPEPEPTPTPEPEPTPTPEPEPTATPEPEPTPTPEPEPTPTPEPEPTATPAPLSGEVSVDDPENDVRSAEGEEPPAAMPFVDLRTVEVDFDDEDEIEIRFITTDDVPETIDPGIILRWTLVVWLDDAENYRLTAVLEGDQWTVLLLDIISGDEIELDIDPDLDDQELTLELPREVPERLLGPFTWAALASFETADGQVFGDNLPDAGDSFTLEPEPDQRVAFPD